MAELPATPSFRLDGKRALVTGAGRGIGLAAAAALAEHGAHVVLAARSLEEIEDGARAISARGGSAEALRLDVCNAEAVTALSTLPAFDILVNNAGTNRPKPFDAVTADDYEAVVDLNLRAAFFVAQSVARGLMAARKPGSLIHISSQMGHVGGPNRTLYCASKWGLEGLNKAMALDLARHGVRSNTIAPTFIDTELTAGFFKDPVFKASVMDKIKLGRLGKVEDLMGAIVFLASDASSMITGTSVVIDGGWTAE
jgi:NAD(P)-dependent dehydrogenase (short-subunit alcohol dehydrogenase family)